MRCLIFAAVAALSFSPTLVFANSLSVDDIVALSKAQLGEDAITAKIQSSGAHFELSTEQMISLRQQGVSSAVIAAMIGTAKLNGIADMSANSPDPMVPHPPGVYAFLGRGNAAKMVKIDPTTSTQMRTGGVFGYALTGGLASMSMKVSVPNETARARTPSMPTFYFFFDDSRPGATTSSFTSSAFLASSPNEFSLVRLERKRGRREAKIGSVGLGGAKIGVMDKDRVQFRYDPVRPGVFRVSPSSNLNSGEYGFLYSLPGGGMGGAATARIFDFGVEGTSAAPVEAASTNWNRSDRLCLAPGQTPRQRHLRPNQPLQPQNGPSATATLDA